MNTHLLKPFGDGSNTMERAYFPWAKIKERAEQAERRLYDWRQRAEAAEAKLARVEFDTVPWTVWHSQQGICQAAEARVKELEQLCLDAARSAPHFMRKKLEAAGRGEPTGPDKETT